MVERIHNYFRSLGLDDEEAESLHMRYYKEYGLAIRGLVQHHACLLYTSPSPRDVEESRMPSSA